MKRAMVAILLLAAACGQASEQQPAANENEEANAAETNAARQEAAPVPSLAGEWQVSQINGAPPRQVWPMIATFSADRLSIQSECRRFTWAFRQQRNIVQFTQGSVQDCARVRSPAELMLEKPVGLANIAMFSNQGREVLLSGPGGPVTLTRR